MLRQRFEEERLKPMEFIQLTQFRFFNQYARFEHRETILI